MTWKTKTVKFKAPKRLREQDEVFVSAIPVSVAHGKILEEFKSIAEQYSEMVLRAVKAKADYESAKASDFRSMRNDNRLSRFVLDCGNFRAYLKTRMCCNQISFDEYIELKSYVDAVLWNLYTKQYGGLDYQSWVESV